MKTLRAFKQGLAAVSRLWEKQEYDAALAKVEELRRAWPGNARLCVLWAQLVQLQESPAHSLHEVKEALRETIDLDKASPAAAIELGRFLDSVEDDPRAALKAFADGVSQARELMLDGLIGQARAYLQLGRAAKALECVGRITSLLSYTPRARPGQTNGSNGSLVEQVEEFLDEIAARSV